MRKIAVILVVLGAVAAMAADEGKPFPHVAPIPAAEAVKTFRALDGFRLDQIAAEPLVTDPVAIAYDENGVAYVLEMNDYPYTDKAAHQAFKENTTDKPIGRVRMLIDTDGDGVYDQSFVFAEGLSWPTGIACYKGGVYVIATPDVWYLKDTTGSHRADVRRKVFTGFRKFNVQAVANNLIWGLDNRLYGAGGSNGGTLTSPEHPEMKPLTLSHNDVRFDPATEQLEAIPGGARFGNSFDDWGRRFVCNIRNPAQHVVIDDGHYLARNPYVPVPTTVHDVAESGEALPVYRTSPPEEWRDFRARRWSTDGTVMPRSELVAGGVVTSSSGVTLYRGDAYPAEFRSQFFLGEPSNNLVLRQLVSPDGVTFTSRRIDDRVDFVTSTDIWFRPVNFGAAPDGCLHVLDMYREVIEHPWSIPDDIRERLDLESGRDRGRIYRLAPPGFVVPKPPRLGAASIEQLVATLESANAWHRETAQRLIVERQDRAAVAPLRQLLAASKTPLGRLHALWTLEGLHAVTVDDVLHGLDDSAAGVRENAIKIAVRHLSEERRLLDRLVRLPDDPDLRVRFQAALTLGDCGDVAATEALAKIARRDAGDPWVLAAVLSGSTARAGGLFARLAGDEAFRASAGGRECLRKLALTVGARNQPAEIAKLFSALPSGVAEAPARLSLAAGLGEGLRRSRRTLRQAVPYAASLLDEVYRNAADVHAALDVRALATRALAFDEFSRSRPMLEELLDPRQPPEVQHAALAALAGINDPAVGPILLGRWSSYTPALRSEAVGAILGYKNRILPLLDRIEAGKISARDIPTSRRAALARHADPEIRSRALKLLGADAATTGGGNAPRKEVIDRYLPALQLKGDPLAGKKTYESICITCHRLGDQGSDLGPNLATVRQWSAEQLLVNILDPNREVAPSFAEYTIELTDGESLSGVIADETAAGVTLKWASGGQRTIPRGSIQRIIASKLSPMPEGLEGSISLQQMADLLALLRQ